jgi:hypothetical protein
MYSTGEASLYLSFLASFSSSSAVAWDSLASRNIRKDMRCLSLDSGTNSSFQLSNLLLKVMAPDIIKLY